MTKPTFYEFFAGGGMARAGLGANWTCLFANDFDAKKVDAYRANWGSKEIRLGDIHQLDSRDLPGRADLAWASFPCQDLSLAGNGAGLDGVRSGAFWGFWRVAEQLRRENRPPGILVLENVVGAVTSNGGKDFEQIFRALDLLGYVYGALTMDAACFLPQSRPRLFIVAVRKDVPIAEHLARHEPGGSWVSVALIRAQAALPVRLQRNWRWWNAPETAGSTKRLGDLIDREPQGVNWHIQAETARLLDMMSEANRQKVDRARHSGERMVGTIYRRTRLNEAGAKVQRAEVRFDGVAGCLRTPQGGSSRQFVMVVEGDSVRTRLLSPREAARLMGVAEDYTLPENYNEAYHLMGDGLAVPVVRHLAAGLLEGLLEQPNRFLAAAE